MSLCSLSYLGGVLDRAAMISCGSDAVTDPVTGRIIMSTFLTILMAVMVRRYYTGHVTR